MKLQLQSSLGVDLDAAPNEAGGLPNGMALRERADVGCVFLNAAVNAAEVIEGGNEALGVQLPARPGSISRGPRCSAIWLTPRAWLVQCPVDDELELASRVNAAFADKRLHAALFTDYLYWLELCGEGAEAILQQGGFVSLERDGLAVGHAKRTLVGNIPAVIIHERKFEWLVGIERSRTKYFVGWLNSVRDAPAG
ncbi:sarcosine oxidase subunit gamma family protein [Peristeroidobacter soli]|uniref:sarcosine oxidase subunit gamma family protein n=1 Tax=Peristeroidobacter soli TaxID=2497877 RepID=UPI00101B5E5B|nr:sarcosine oxidase subunit gamma family protein [Peristeroidobacter soli]